MGVRFRKSIKIAKGVRANVGKKSVGVSVGGKYGGMSFNTKNGARVRSSLPGTGISYSTKIRKSKKKSNNTYKRTRTVKRNKRVELFLCVFFGYIGAHKFYEGNTKAGLLYLLTFGLLGIGWIKDIVVLAKECGVSTASENTSHSEWESISSATVSDSPIVLSTTEYTDYDELLPNAADVIFETQQTSVSMLQRRLNLGYSRAARIMDQLERLGVVGPLDGSNPRDLLITCEKWQSLYQKIRNGNVCEADSMNGHDFEYWCANLLQRNGFSDVEVTPGSGDQGVDVLASKDGVRYAVQCKCYHSDLGNTPVQEVNTGKAIYHCHVGAVMTNRYFTSGAKEAAEATGVLLWDRDKLSEMLKNCEDTVVHG